MIVEQSGRTETGWEDCFSVPGLMGLVPRAETVTVQYTAADGTDVAEQYSGYASRVIQHEVDHLGGVEFVDRMTSMESLTTVNELLRVSSVITAVSGVRTWCWQCDSRRRVADFDLGEAWERVPTSSTRCAGVLGNDLQVGQLGPDGRVDVGLTGQSPQALAWCLAGFGAGVLVLDPPETRHHLAEIGRELVHAYASSI